MMEALPPLGCQPRGSLISRPVEHFYIAFIYAARINVYSGRLESLILLRHVFLSLSLSFYRRLLLCSLVVVVVDSLSSRSSLQQRHRSCCIMMQKKRRETLANLQRRDFSDTQKMFDLGKGAALC